MSTVSNEHTSLSHLKEQSFSRLFFCSVVSVSSFVKKTTEKINTLQMNSELRQRPEFRENVQAESTPPYSEEMDHE